MPGCDWTVLVDAKKNLKSYILPQWLKKRFKKKILIYNLEQTNFPILILSPLEEDVTFHFNIHVFKYPLPKDTPCQVWLKLTKWFLSRRFLKVLNVFSLCGYYFPLKNA